MVGDNLSSDAGKIKMTIVIGGKKSGEKLVSQEANR